MSTQINIPLNATDLTNFTLIDTFNGFKLYKDNNRNSKQIILTPDGDKISFNVFESVAIDRFHNAISNNALQIEYVSYSVKYMDGIITEKTTRRMSVSKKTNILNGTETSNNIYFSSDDAIQAISAVLPKAEVKFNLTSKALEDLQASLGFSTGYHYEGDSFGIYNEYDYISFTMDGFYFQFRND